MLGTQFADAQALLSKPAAKPVTDRCHDAAEQHKQHDDPNTDVSHYLFRRWISTIATTRPITIGVKDATNGGTRPPWAMIDIALASII